MHKRLLIVPLVGLTILGLFAFCLLNSQQVLASPNCAETVTVRRGDTMARIAAQHQTTVAELLQLNSTIKDPHHIYVGQVLCVSATANNVGVEQEALNSKIVIEAMYQMTPTTDAEDGTWNLQPRNGLVGKRVEYPLATIDSLRFTTQTQDLKAVFEQSPAPTLLVRRNESDEKYTLVSIGDGPPWLSSLLITPTATISTGQPCVSVPIKQALDQKYAQDVSATLLLESRDGLQFPLDISKVDQVPTTADAIECYSPAEKPEVNRVILILSPSSAHDGTYQATVFMWNNVFGPDGIRQATRCSSWAGKRSLFYRVLRSFRGC